MLKVTALVTAAEQPSDCCARQIRVVADAPLRGASTRVPRAPHPGGLSRRLLDLLRPLPVVLLLGWLLVRTGPAPSTASREPDLSRAMSIALQARGLTAEASEIFWVDPPPGLIASRRARPRALVRARRGDAPADIYLTRCRLSPEGRLLELSGLYNLSDTSAVDEQRLTVRDRRAAWVIGGGGKVYSVHLADLAGEPLPHDAEWTRQARWQQRVSNLQQTGQLAGVARRSFKLDPASSTVTLALSENALLIRADGHKIRIPTAGPGSIEGQRFVQEQARHLARPGNFVTWAVDRVRSLPWFGSDRMQLLKAVAFAALDLVQRFVGTVTGDDGSDRIADELGDLLDTPPAEYADPESGWPPAPMEPMLDPPLADEGKWRLLDGDPFVRKNPGTPAPFVTSFIRTDRKRAFSQIFVTLWDPRQVKLHAMSGTVEPKSATGETGPGMVPREPEVMGRLLAGLNGGFQATHGEWGMMAAGVVYLPPKPYAATVAELADGSTGFGTWPNDEHVPDDMVSFRQNMTPLVMDEQINPYRRSWWGGVPPGWTDESRTVRSAICLTREKFVAYLYGTSIDADHLALAMQRARCEYGIHLDMNPGHTGLEFYQAGPASEIQPLARPLDGQWEAEGEIEGMPGWRFRGRRMIRYMGLMNFPRYIQREARDFFYLTLRDVLPGKDVPAPLAAAGEPEGKWRVKGLPQHGWPYAVATTWLRPDRERKETKVRLLKIDPRQVAPSRGPGEKRPTVVSLPRADGAARHGLSLWWSPGSVTVSGESPDSRAVRLATGMGAKHADSARVVAAVGVDRSGMLIYAEVTTAPRPGADQRLLVDLFAAIDCTEIILLDAPLALALGGDRDLSGHPLRAPGDALTLIRTNGPAARRIFPDTPIVGSDVWYPLQAKRVRYFRKPKPAEASADEQGSDPTAATAVPADEPALPEPE